MKKLINWLKKIFCYEEPIVPKEKTVFDNECFDAYRDNYKVERCLAWPWIYGEESQKENPNKELLSILEKEICACCPEKTFEEAFDELRSASFLFYN